MEKRKEEEFKTQSDSLEDQLAGIKSREKLLTSKKFLYVLMGAAIAAAAGLGEYSGVTDIVDWTYMRG